jgi:hypothetical protein
VSDDLVLTEVLAAQPLELERRLGIAMHAIGCRIVERPEIVRAMAAADQLRPGYVIASETQAVEIADLVAQVIDGEKALAEQIGDALRIPKRMEEALKGAVDVTKRGLLDARQVGNGARVAWQATLRRQAAALEEKRRQEAQEAAQRAAEQAAETGEDAPPPAEVAPVEVPRTVAGVTGKMGTMVTFAAVEIVEWADCPKGWLVLVPATALAGFRAAAMAGEVKKPEPGESVVYKGVRFEARESAVNRR